jgi:RNA polymerase sigma-70 factor, ECF subfamily
MCRMVRSAEGAVPAEATAVTLSYLFHLCHKRDIIKRMGTSVRRRRRAAPRVVEHPPAFSVLLRPRMLLAIGRWLRRLGVPRHERADVVQDVLLEAWKGWHAYDPQRGRPERWLNRIAVRVATDFHVRARKRCRFSGDRIDAQFRARQRTNSSSRITTTMGSNDAPNPVFHAEWNRAAGVEAAIAREEMRAALLGALSALPRDQAAVIVAHDIDGLSMTEVAVRLGTPGSTLYHRRARGLAALAVLLRPPRE